MQLTQNTPFGAEWTRAATSSADVITVETVSRLALPRLGDARHAAAVPGASKAYQIERVPNPLGRFATGWRAREQARRIAQLLKYVEYQIGPVDVVHTHFYASAQFVPYLKARQRVAVVHTEHSSSLTADAAPGKRASRAGMRYAHRTYQSCDHIIPVSRFLLGSIRWRQLPGRMTVIGNPVDTGRFRPMAMREKRPPAIQVASVGRLEHDKGMDRVIRAFDVAAQHDARLALQIVGDGPDAQALRSLASSLPSRDRITFAGRCSRDDTATRVRASHIYLSGARVETFGVAVAEGLAAGLPVVGPRIPALEELIDDERGVLVTPGDHRALGDALLTVARSLDRYEPDPISRWVHDRFSYEAVGAQLLQVYESMTGRTGVMSP